MKKGIASLFLAAVLAIVLGIVAFADDSTIVASGDCGRYGNNLTWTLDSTGLLTISGQGEMKDYKTWWPPEDPVHFEYSETPWERDKVKSVYIQDGVTEIGSAAFRRCGDLTSVTIPDSVRQIGEEGFSRCSRLTGVTIPDSVTSIDWSAFYGCSSLTSVTIPDSVTSIGRSTFSGCSNLTSVTIPDSVTGIEGWAFFGCRRLTSVTIPDTVTYIGEKAFSECDSLVDMVIPDGVTRIEDYAFYKCSSLASVMIPDSVTSVGDWAFSQNSNLKEIYYGGTESQWLKISADSRILFDDQIYFEGQKSAALKAVPDFLGSTGKPYIKWKAVDGAVKYMVYRSTSETGNYKWLRTTTQLNYTDTTAELGRNYYYKVRPVGSGGFAGNLSEPVRALCRCGRPVVKSDYLTSTGKPYLTWSAVDGASKYQVYRAASKNGTYKLLGTTTKLSYTDTATNTGYTYFYKIKAVCKANSSATSAYSAAVSAISHCAKPVVKTGYIASSGKPYLKWSTIIGASKYYVYRSSSEGGPYKYIGSTTETSYTDPSAYAGYTYYYKVKAISRVKTSANSVYSSVAMTVCHCAKPVVKITTSSGDPKLTWRTVTGASKYEVYRATSRSGTYTKVATTTAKTYTNKSAKAGKTYYYKVKAVSKVKTSANSAYSAVKSIKAR